MSRPSLHFLRPYLYRGFTPLVNADAALAFCAIQRRLAQTVATDPYTGPRDVEKQKRLEQLQKVKPLGDYHPRLEYPSHATILSVHDFHAEYDKIRETQTDLASVFGMAAETYAGGMEAYNVRKSPISAAAWLQADVPRY